ncbi:retron Ec78 anti-phage system effector HNH endonuclease PtuB [Thioalkalivibrio sp. ALgr3]|uniref:retron Ec78 anti-phage system effector HNH endonuclease PtuB n=1 Tax=Thioalkalivibrio sp. ALgr3 TaxID=1239292 RepID=UPI000476E96D|nr:retron Ec78 anti-phage system effector HNH endonuclease PtuB [Thioalkalivibrio sp. ALgr3]
MHKLERPEAPRCLGRYRAGRDGWGDVTSPDKTMLWERLDAMQSERCAYCEVELRQGQRHIEHFRMRSTHPRDTFAWENLFGSCNRPDCCGKHKDPTRHDPADLIKPDEDDPDEYLRFLANGRITPRAGLSARQVHRAKETVRVFNLNHESLRWMRYRVVQGYLFQAEELVAWSEIDQAEYEQYLRRELAAISGEPFETAIRHFLTEA